MLTALINGETVPLRIADRAKGRMAPRALISRRQ